MAFYVDSCIYLNLWQKEESNEKQFWRYALQFFDAVERAKEIIFFSGFVLKELSFILHPEEFLLKKQIFTDDARFKRIIATNGDYNTARKFESEAHFEISFFDCMHLVLAKRANAVLITRDKKLTDFALSKDCLVAKPEDIRIY